MNYNAKRLYIGGFLIFSGVELLFFLAFYVSNFIVGNDGITPVWEYIRYFADDLITFLFPPIVAGVMLIGKQFFGFGHVSLFTLPLAASRLFYYVPYYYLYHLFMGFDSVEAILLSLAMSVLFTALTYLWIIFMVFIGSVVLTKQCVKCGTDPRFALKNHSITDLGEPIAAATFCVVMISFIADFIQEVINTVSYLLEYVGTYRTSEIIYIVFCFAFLIVKLLAAQTVVTLVRRSIARRRIHTESVH